MAADPFSAVPAMPPGIAAWEELLIRLELGPRAVRITLEGAAPGDWVGRTDEAGWNAAAHLAHLAARESEVAAWLAALRDGTALEPWRDAPDAGTFVDVGTGAIERDVYAYTERRSRNFAAVQRRGLEVWDWRSDHPEHGPVSTYQLLSYLVQHDGRHLARLRLALRGGS
jgi:hypothetical protein